LFLQFASVHSSQASSTLRNQIIEMASVSRVEPPGRDSGQETVNAVEDGTAVARLGGHDQDRESSHRETETDDTPEEAPHNPSVAHRERGSSAIESETNLDAHDNGQITDVEPYTPEREIVQSLSETDYSPEELDMVAHVENEGGNGQTVAETGGKSESDVEVPTLRRV
jgi:hypothetical protein